VPDWIQEVTGRIERELLRANFDDDFASEDELQRRLIITVFKVLGERVKSEPPDSEASYLMSVFRRQILSELQRLRRRFCSFDVARIELMIPNEAGDLRPTISAEVSERAVILGSIARRDGRAISWNPVSDPRLRNSPGEATSMLALRLDDEDEASSNVVIAIAGSVSPLVDSSIEQLLFDDIALACDQLRFTLHRYEDLWNLNDLFQREPVLGPMLAVDTELTVDTDSRTSQIGFLYGELEELSAMRAESPDDANLQRRFNAVMNELRALQQLEAEAIERHAMKRLTLPFDEGERAISNAEELLARHANPSTSDIVTK
jgi:hypothetical protein